MKIKLDFGKTYKGLTVDEIIRLGNHLNYLHQNTEPYFYFALFGLANKVGKN